PPACTMAASSLRTLPDAGVRPRIRSRKPTATRALLTHSPSVQQDRNRWGHRWGHELAYATGLADLTLGGMRSRAPLRRLEWARLDSNQGPTGYEPAALTAELRARCDERTDGCCHIGFRASG